MTEIGDIEPRLERLCRRRRFGIKLGLDIERSMLAALGNPQNSYMSVHVAGTNGKGSVCALVESALRAAGYRTGMYTSPHLIRFNERFIVDGRPIDDDKLREILDAVEQAAGVSERECGREATFFEVSTAMAFHYFRQQSVEIAVIETGMGGRMDATNVVTPVVSVITPVSLEHSEYLGSTIADIAFEKCGIIKKGVPVVSGVLHDDAMDVARSVCAQMGVSPIPAPENVVIDVISRDMNCQKVRVETGSRSYGTMSVPLAGRHQLENLAVALTVIDVLADTVGLELNESAVKKGIARTKWPGRFQVISADPPVIVDGAHNPHAAQALADTVTQVFGNGKIAMVLAMCSDKDLRGFLRPFAGRVGRIWAVPVRNERAMNPAHIVEQARAMGLDAVEITVDKGLAAAVEWAEGHDSIVCVTGSLFLVGETLAGREDAMHQS